MMKKLVYLSPRTEALVVRFEGQFMTSTFGENGTEQGTQRDPDNDVEWPGGGGERIPAYATRCVQDPDSKVFCAQVWAPEKPYRWRKKRGPKITNPLIYEVHIGMSSEQQKVASFTEFREQVLPRVIETGYNTLQIMALQEHPYYGSFGYQVSNFFALSSRFGTPEEFKALVDAAHKAGIAVIMDVVHSHAVKNEVEGLSRLDGSYTTYFHEGPRG